MNVAGTDAVEKMNVVPLFSSVEIEIPDPLESLLTEGEMAEDQWALEEESMSLGETQRVLVSPQQFPDQSMYVLEKQVSSLKESLARLKFYLGDLDDLLPR